ncbi:hypothetical protein GCM10009527_031700 [Actinomadura nitritigenes]
MTSEASSVEIRLDAHSRGVTSRCTGLTAMVSMAAGSSRMRRAPMSAVIADPPAPAMISAAAIGATSRTSPTTTAPPVADWAPSWAASCPTCSATVAPSGSDTRITGRLVTRARNQACSANSQNQRRTSQVRRSPSRDDDEQLADLAEEPVDAGGQVGDGHADHLLGRRRAPTP